MSTPPPSRFDQLNWLGKALFIGGQTLRYTAEVVDGLIERATDLAVEVEQAFRQGVDDGIEDAHILEEYNER